MEHERGAFKVNSPDRPDAVKKSPDIRPFRQLVVPEFAAGATK